MKKRDKRKRAQRHQIAKDQQIVEEILETEKLKSEVKVVNIPVISENDEKLLYQRLRRATLLGGSKND